jgi:hypothetical protein
VRKAVILFVMVAVQVFLGIFSHSIPFVVVLHVLNAFGILAMAIMAARSASVVTEAPRTSAAV